MSTAVSTREPGRWLHRLAYALPVILAVNAAGVAFDPWRLGAPGIVDMVRHPWGTGWHASMLRSPGTDLVGVLGLAALAAVAATVRHTMTLCPACAQRLPLDPQGEAVRWRSGLRAVHWEQDHIRAILLAYLAAILVLPAGWPLNVGFLAVFTLGAVLSVAALKHSLLQPWCPWCRHPGGGEGTMGPAPGPGARLPVGGATR